MTGYMPLDHRLSMAGFLSIVCTPRHCLHHQEADSASLGRPKRAHLHPDIADCMPLTLSDISSGQDMKASSILNFTG